MGEAQRRSGACCVWGVGLGPAAVVKCQAACPAGAEKLGLRVEEFTPSAEVRAEVERIARVSRLDVGGIEYLESRRDGWRYYYDVNALSNFVADPVRVVGFDPTARLVDALVERSLAPAPEVRARAEHQARRARRATPVAGVRASASAITPADGIGVTGGTVASPAAGVAERHAGAVPSAALGVES